MRGDLLPREFQMTATDRLFLRSTTVRLALLRTLYLRTPMICTEVLSHRFGKKN